MYYINEWDSKSVDKEKYRLINFFLILIKMTKFNRTYVSYEIKNI